jgi:hypothetical protein
MRLSRSLATFRGATNTAFLSRQQLVPIALACSPSLSPYSLTLLARLTSKNQLTLPKLAIDTLGPASCFEVVAEGDRLILMTARIGGAAAVRAKLGDLGITSDDVAGAVTWARRRR